MATRHLSHPYVNIVLAILHSIICIHKTRSGELTAINFFLDGVTYSTLVHGSSILSLGVRWDASEDGAVENVL